MAMSFNCRITAGAIRVGGFLPWLFAATHVFAGALLFFGTGAAHAQAYPAKPIRLILPHPPGGTSDLIGRLLAKKMGDSMGQPVLVDNRAGAATMIAATAVATAPADGYTLMVHVGQLYTNPLMYRSIRYKTDDFVPISLVAQIPYALSVSNTVPAKNAKEFVAWLKANPGKASYATLGAGGNTHLLGKMLEEVTGVSMVDVPYKGSGPAMTDLIGGQVQLYFDTVATSIPMFREGRIKILGVTSERRLPGAPDLPTLKEQGVDITGDTWWGVLGPAKLPRPIVERIHSEVVKAVESEEFRSLIVSRGGVAVSSGTPEEFARFIAADTEKWARVIRPLNLQLD